VTRTNIDIDDALIAEIMQTYRFSTKREAVDFALRHARRPKPLTVAETLAMLDEGGFMDPDFDFEAFRAPRVFDPPAKNRTA
jgi:Arc/MetJ family transcription regulator